MGCEKRFFGAWFGGWTSDEAGLDSGIFNMKVKLLDDEHFTGICSDKRGKSRVEGKLEKGAIEFTKKYCNPQGDTFRGPLYYD